VNEMSVCEVFFFAMKDFEKILKNSSQNSK